MTHAALKDLLPCPFCSGSARLTHSEDVDGCYWTKVKCDGCGVETRGKWASSRANACHVLYAEAREEWNRRAALSAMEGDAVAWPNRMVNLPCPDGSTDRIVGFRVPEGDTILGKHGLSEPLAWLRKVTVERTAPPPQQANPVDRELETPRRSAAVTALLGMGWRWDGKYWESPQQAEKKLDLPESVAAAFLALTRDDSTPQEIEARMFLMRYIAIYPTPSPGPQGGGEGYKFPAEIAEWFGGPHDYPRDVRDAAEERDELLRDYVKLAKAIGFAEYADFEQILAAATPPAHQPGEVVTDAMVEAAITALMLERGREDWLVTPSLKSDMRAALTAALAPKEAGHDR